MNKVLLLLSLMTMSLHAQNLSGIIEIDGCNREGSLRDFIKTCLFNVGGTKVEREDQGSAKWKVDTVKRIFGLSRANTITRISNPGAMAYVTDVKLVSDTEIVVNSGKENLDNAVLLAESLNEHGDRGLYGLSRLNEETVNKKKFKWKYVEYTCEGYVDGAGKPLIKGGWWNRTLDEKGQLYYSKVKKNSAYIAKLFVANWKYLSSEDEAWDWSDEKAVANMSVAEKKQLKLYRIIESRIGKDEIYQIVSVEEGMLVLVFQRPTDKDTHRWEIVAIDNTDCSA